MSARGWLNATTARLAIAGALLWSCSSDTHSRSGASDETTGKTSQALNLSPTIGNFVLYAERSLTIGTHDLVTGGDVGVRSLAASNFSGSQLLVSDFAQVDGTHSLLAPSVSVGSHAQVGDVQTTSLQNNGANAIGQVAPFPASAMPLAPLALAPASSGSAINVPSQQTLALTPGTYGALTMADHSVVTLGPGAYSFASVAVGQHCQLLGDAAGVTVQIAGSLTVSGWTTIAPASAAPASALLVSVAAFDTASQSAVSLAEHDQVTALLAAPNGTLVVADHVQALGALAAFDLSLGDHVQVAFQSGFSQTVAYPHGLQTILGEVMPAIASGSMPVVGKLPGTTMVTLAIGLPLRNMAQLQSDIASLSDPTSPLYRSYMTPDQFGAAYGPQSDYDTLVSFAQSNGFSFVKYPTRDLLAVTGTASAVESTFFVSLNLYARDDGTTFFAPANDPSADLAASVLHISGLDSFAVPIPATGSGPPNFGICDEPQNADNSYVGPDFRKAYLPCAATTLDGTGQSVALLENAAFLPQDVAQYVSNWLPGVVPTLTIVEVPDTAPTFAPTPGVGELEASLDIDMVLAVAPGAHVYVYEENPAAPFYNGALILKQMQTEDVAKVISSSWTWHASMLDGNNVQTFMEYARQGQSFFQASGDYGAYLPGNIAAAYGRNVPEPMISSSMMTVVGGTLLKTDAAQNYLSETTWNLSAAASYYAGGGGFCTGYGGVPTLGIPSYQVNVNPTNTEVAANPLQARMIPDVSMIAAQIALYAEAIPPAPPGTSQLACTDGTSAATPLWAGIAVLANQTSGPGGPIGFANPRLYATAATSSIFYQNNFHDISDDSNNHGFFTSGSDTAYHAVQGYDMATGLGSPQCAMIAQLACVTTCGGPSCVYLDSDANNCGACGNACATGSQCVGGQCATITVNISSGTQPQACITGVGLRPRAYICVQFMNAPAGSSFGACDHVDVNGQFADLDLSTSYVTCTPDQATGVDQVFFVALDIDTGLQYTSGPIPAWFFCSDTHGSFGTGPTFPCIAPDGTDGLFFGSHGM